MKKVLCLSLVASSMFSMQLDLVKQDSSPEKLSHPHINLKTGNITKLRSALVSTHELTQVELNSLSKVCIDPKAFFAPESFGSVELYHSKKGFSIYQDGKKHVIQKCFSDPVLRNITREQLGAFLQVGYLSINRMDDGEFSLRAKGRVIGGGPYFGAFMYWLTKSCCYGGLIAATSTIAAATGGAAISVVGATVGATGAAVGTGASVGVGVATHVGAFAAGSVVTGAAASTTVATVTAAGIGAGVASTATAAVATTTATAVSFGAGTAAAVVTGAGLAGEAGMVTGAVLATGATAGAIVAGIETFSLLVGLQFGMLPTP